MTRTPRGRGRPSPNTSNPANSSIFDDAEKRDLTYSEIIEAFTVPQLEQHDIVGCKEIVAGIKHKIELLQSLHEQNFVYITGPPRTGKTMIVRKLAAQYPSINFIYFNAGWALDRRFSQTETRFAALFKEALQKAPSLIFIDQIDLVCAKKPQNDLKERVFNVLENELENLLTNSGHVLVFAATNQPESINSHIVECFFLDKIKFVLPTKQDRLEMFTSFSADRKNLITQEELNKVAEDSHCYRYPELLNLHRIAEEHSNGPLNYESFKFALSVYKPSSISGLTTPCPPTKWEDIGGNAAAKEELHRYIIQPLRHKAKFINTRSNRGALLHGPPGCSKTMLARAVATESGYNFINIRGPQLYSKYVGDSEAAIRKLYSDARTIAPCIIFFDEIDGLVTERNSNQSSNVGDKMVTALLAELDGVQPLDNVFTIAATNRPQKLDSALLRPGRLYPQICIPLPSASDRRDIFKVHARRLDLKLDGTLLDRLVIETHKYSGADISFLCENADDIRMNEETPIEWRHFEEALEKMKQTAMNLQKMNSAQLQSRQCTRIRSKLDKKTTSLNARMRYLSIRRTK